MVTIQVTGNYEPDEGEIDGDDPSGLTGDAYESLMSVPIGDLLNLKVECVQR